MQWRVAVTILVLASLIDAQMLLTSPAFTNLGDIPSKFGCDVQERDMFRPSPPLAWVRPPARTRSFVLVVDNMSEDNLVHWIVKDIPADVTSLAADASETNIPSPAVEVTNGFGRQAYNAPCPLDATHNYRFRLFAMPTTRTEIDDSNNATAVSDALVQRLMEQSLYVSVLIGSYSLGPPSTRPIIAREYNINMTQYGHLAVNAEHMTDCHWAVFEIEEFILSTLLISDIKIQGASFERFDFEAEYTGRTSMIIGLFCYNDEASTKYVRINVRIFPPSPLNATLTIRLTKPPMPNLGVQRYIKPSEVLRAPEGTAVAAARGTGTGTEGDVTCGSVPGTEGCSVQLLVDSTPKVEKSLEQVSEQVGWDLCPAMERRTRRTIQKDELAPCTMRVRFANTNCSNLEIPSQYLCTEHSPAIEWTSVPSGTRSIILAVEDAGPLDGNREGKVRIHWLVTDVAHVSFIDSNVSKTDRMPPLSVELSNSFQSHGFSNMCFRESHLVRLHAFAMPHPRTFIGSLHPRSHNSTAALANLSVSDIARQLQREALCGVSVELTAEASQNNH